MQSDLAAVLAVLDKITPGEWRVCSDETVTVRDARDGSIASLGWLTDRLTGPRRSSAEVHANARATAALPELAALYRAGVAVKIAERAYTTYEKTLEHSGLKAARQAFDAALAAVAEKLANQSKTQGE